VNFLGGIWNYMEARRRRRQMETAVFFGVGCSALLICGVIVVIVGSIMNAVEAGNVNRLYGDYAQACQPVPGGDEDEDNMPDADTPRQLLLLTGGTQRRHTWHSELPAQWQAENEDEVVLVGCVEEEEVTVETCEYQRDSGEGDGYYTVTIELIQYEATITLINPDTGRVIDSRTEEGSDPDDCPDDDDVTVSSDEYGSEVEWDDFDSWIEDYVFDE